MIKDYLISKLRKEFPEIKFQKAELITKGWDHDILVLDDKRIVRFIKEKLDKNNFVREIAFLKEFSKISNLKVPEYTFVSKDATFGGYEIIPGKELTRSLYKTLTLQQKENFIKDLAEFISMLHTIPLEQAKKFGFEGYESWEQDLQKKEKWFENEFWPKMGKHLTARETEFIKNFMASFIKSQHRITPVLGHYDLSHDHIMMNGDGKISGVIDFGDVSIGDPAHEFNGFMDYDENLPQQIYELYRGPKDSTFLNRCQDHFVHRWIFLMYDGLIRRKDESLWLEAREKINNIIENMSDTLPLK